MNLRYNQIRGRAKDYAAKTNLCSNFPIRIQPWEAWSKMVVGGPSRRWFNFVPDQNDLLDQYEPGVILVQTNMAPRLVWPLPD